MGFDLKKHTHYLVISGSRSFGMHTASSDVDVKGFAIPPIQYFLSGFKNNPDKRGSGFQQVDNQKTIHKTFLDCLHSDEQIVTSSSKLEGTVYDFNKYIRLCNNNNPSILETLFAREDEIRIGSEIAMKLREFAPNFLSQRVKWAYSGYAYDQLKRIENHRRWMLSPVLVQPRREDFGLAPTPQYNQSELGALRELCATYRGMLRERLGIADDIYNSAEARAELHPDIDTFMDEIIELTKSFGFGEKIMTIFQAEKSFQSAMSDYKKYHEWTSTRNHERFLLESQFGYDTKHAAHLIRLMRMCVEILSTGKVHVYRPDAEELLEIRKGCLSYDDLIIHCEDLKVKAEEAAKMSLLPVSPDLTRIEDFTAGLLIEHFGIE